jgi:SH3-like domain-containing protein
MRNPSHAVRFSLSLIAAALLLFPVAPATASDSVVACDFNAFPIDRDPKGSNVRSGPGPENRVIATISDQDSEIAVTGVAGKWLRIRHAESVDGKVFLDGEGWLFAALTGVTARSAIKLHATPDGKSAVVGSMPADSQGTVLSCTGKWVQVQAGQVKGWMAPETHCGNPVTTCT